MPYEIDGEAVINTLRELANENPDYVYVTPDELVTEQFDETACYYVHPSPAGPMPGCIAAHALHRLGVPLEVLADNEHMGVGALNDSVYTMTGPYAGRAVVALNAAQDAQDGSEWDGRRRTWSEAVAIAEQRAGLEVV